MQGYNAQAMVSKDQIIIAGVLTQDVNDVRQLGPMITAALVNLETVSDEEAALGAVLADAGYWVDVPVPLVGTGSLPRRRCTSSYRRTTCFGQQNPLARARAPAPSSLQRDGERLSSRIASASLLTQSASLWPYGGTARPQVASTIVPGPPSLRQITGSPWASDSRTALPLESCRLGNSSASCPW
jgi:hypothetical protein